MAIPNFQHFLSHVLNTLKDNQVKQRKEIYEKVIESMEFSEEEMNVRVKSGEQVVINRAGWAITYLNKAEAIERVQRGYYRITDRGHNLFDNYGYDLRKVHLEEFESFLEFQNISNDDIPIEPTLSEEITPEEQVEQAIKLLQKELAEEIINEVMEMSPYFFERLVLDLLFHMGYGGKNRDSFIHTQYGHDGGIDGLIKEDELGLDYVYIQAKRWKNTVTAPEIQKFSGALHGQGANKGVFITTSSFSQGAIDYAKRNISNRIVLIDGKQLAELMIIYEVGVSTEEVYKIQKIDSDYFVEE